MREGCVLKTLGDLFSIGSSKRVYESQWRTKGVPFYRAREIVRLSRDGYVDNELFIDEELYVELSSKYGIPKAGDIMVTGVGTLGICYIVKENDRFYFKDGNTLWFKTKEGTNPQYVQYAFKSEFLRRQIDNCVGATVGTFTIERANKTTIPVPSFEEQARIVAELDLLTGIIDKQKQQLKELDTLAQSIFYDMFGSVDNNTKNFMVKCLNEVFQLITDGTHQTPQYTDDILHGFKFLSAKDVVSGVIDWTRIKYIPESLHNELYKRLAPRRGDILLCKNGTTGICALVETDEVFDIYVSLALLRTEKEYNKKYLVYAINNPSTKSQFDDSLKGVGVPNLHLGEIKKTKILVPPIELQSSFAKKIESIESQKEFINRSIAESQKLFDYTMDKYFG